MPRKALKKRKDGRYVCSRDGIPFYGYSSLEAYGKRDAYDLAKAQGLRHESVGVSVAEYAAKWLPIYRHDSCTKSYNAYRKVLEAFAAFMGNGCRMKDVTKSDITAFYNMYAEYSQSHIDKAVTTIRGLFEAAADDRLILASPCTGVKKPQGKSGTHRAIEPWERELVHRMVDKKHRFSIAAMLMLYGGLRRGEALAFDIDRDVDFDNGRIYVREAMSYTEDFRGIVGDTKTDAGVRDLPLFAPLRECLQGKHGLAVKPARAKKMTESAFASAWASYLYEMSVLHNDGRRPRWIGHTKADKAALARGEKLPPWVPVHIQTHDFRHSFCTMICDADVDIKTAMSWMGHSDEKMIREIYDHLTDLRKKKAEKKTAAIIDQMFAKCKKDVQSDVQSKNTNRTAQ